MAKFLADSRLQFYSSPWPERELVNVVLCEENSTSDQAGWFCHHSRAHMAYRLFNCYCWLMSLLSSSLYWYIAEVFDGTFGLSDFRLLSDCVDLIIHAMVALTLQIAHIAHTTSQHTLMSGSTRIMWPCSLPSCSLSCKSYIHDLVPHCVCAVEDEQNCIFKLSDLEIQHADKFNSNPMRQASAKM